MVVNSTGSVVRSSVRPLEDRNIVGEMATWGPLHSIADECSFTFAVAEIVAQEHESHQRFSNLKRGEEEVSRRSAVGVTRSIETSRSALTG